GFRPTTDYRGGREGAANPKSARISARRAFSRVSAPWDAHGAPLAASRGPCDDGHAVAVRPRDGLLLIEHHGFSRLPGQDGGRGPRDSFRLGGRPGWGRGSACPVAACPL